MKKASPMEGRSRSKIVRFLVLLFYAAAFGLIGWLVWNNREEVLVFLSRANYLLLFSSLISFLLSALAATLGWRSIVDPFTSGVIPWRDHIRVYAATLASRRLPGTIWYVGGRLTLYKQMGVQRRNIVLASSLELAVIVVSGLAVGANAFLETGIASASTALLVAAGVVIAGLIASPYLLRKLSVRLKTTLNQNLGVGNILVWLFWYALMWIAGGVMLVQIIASFQAVDPTQIPFLIGSWALSGALGTLTFFLPSSFGVTELSLVFFLARFMPLTSAGIIAIFTRILGTLFEVILSAAFLPFIKDLGNNPPAPSEFID